VEELGRFAGLYADHVIIHNFLADHSPTFGHPPPGESHELRQFVADDITLICTLKPFVDAGLISLFTPPKNVCPGCSARHAFGPKARQRLQTASRKLLRDVNKHVSAKCFLDNGELYVVLSGPDEILPHGRSGLRRRTIPKIIMQNRKLMDRLRNGEIVPLSKAMFHTLELAESVSGSILHSVDCQIAVASTITASFLTHRDVDLDVLRYVSSDPEMVNVNYLLAKHFNLLLPFVQEVPLSRIVDLRRRDPDGFVQFRAALKSTLQEAYAKKRNFSSRDARELYSDIIAPEIARLNKRMREAKRDLAIGAIGQTIATVGVLVVCIYSGLVPAQFQAAAQDLGILKVLNDLTVSGIKQSDFQKQIRNERYYFLWKVKHGKQDV
jgi:hypothetical protein